MPRLRLFRLVLPAVLALGLVTAACDGGGTTTVTTPTGPPTSPTQGPPAKGSIAQLQKGAKQLSLIQAQSQIPVGHSLFTFGLSTSGGGLVQGGAPFVFVAQSPDTVALGPFVAAFHRFHPASDFNDKTIPRSPITGFYTADIDVPVAGNWLFAAEIKSGSSRAVGVGGSKVITAVPNAVGSKAISVKTPVAHSLKQAREIDTRVPPSPMHYISLDQALKNHKPTVVVFSTPLLCESRLCGPVTDEVLKVFQTVGKGRANFIHVEEFLPGKDLRPPSAELKNQSPGFKAWHLTTEPWVFVIDSHGVIRARFEGPSTAGMVLAALKPLLGK